MSATSWNSELPSGRNPFWIKDDALIELGLHPGDAVSVDTRREPANGDLVLVEIETDQFSDRLARLYFTDEAGQQIRLVAANPSHQALLVSPDQLLILGVVCARVRFEADACGALRVIESAL